MAYKFALVCLTIVAACAGTTLAVDLIELTDANQAILNLELSKALGGVQNAYKKEFKFESVSETKKFLGQCETIRAAVGSAEDSAFEGMAKQIRAIMAEPSISMACSVTAEQLTEDFAQLDDLSRGDSVHAPLSSRVLNLLVSLTEKVHSNPNLKTVLGHLLKKRTDETTESLLTGAPNDIEILIGETHEKTGFFDFESRYRKFCEISLVAPICKLVRATTLDTPAIAADVNKFAKVVESNDAAQLAEHTDKSGVSMDELKSSCKKLRRDLRPVEQINKYLAAGLLSEETLAAHRQTDANLDSYVALFDLCQLVL